MLQRFYTLLFAFALLFPATSALNAADYSPVLKRIQERGELVLGTSGNMPPMTRQLINGAVVGFDIDLAETMAGAMGVKLVVKVLPFDKLIPALQNDKVDVIISNMTMNPERNMQVAFVGPYLTSGKCVITKEESLAKADKAAKIDAEHKRIAVMKGSTSETFANALMKNSKIIPVSDDEKGADLVASGKADALLTEMPICQAILNSHEKAGFVAINSNLTYEPIGIAISGKDALFINWTNNFLVRMNATGLLKILGQKWMGQSVE